MAFKREKREREREREREERDGRWGRRAARGAARANQRQCSKVAKQRT